ncbi:hypothetical protein F0562_026760 [Nyssa sinensis]|uniref:Dof zinc finger protein n=1 Tax=Nyssa sinensis TaxID=561372 RepID=A0A5J5BBN9_9ASTE|nr:hypothetical protein F0562_026760 [Nyssa sinensis]
MDAAQWPQGIGLPMEGSRPMVEKKPRPNKEQALNCPRCNSSNTKFCYYNNYSLAQPRYFCKTCRRYWTEGGSLRNVPVGGGSRKNKRSSTSSSSPPSSSKKFPDLTPPSFSQSASQNPKIHEGQDLNLSYPPTSDYNSISSFVDLPCNDSEIHHQNPNPSQLLKSGITSRDLINSFMPIPVADASTIYSSGFPLQELKQSLNFSVAGFQSGYGSLQGIQESSARIFFPFEDIKQVTSTSEFEQNRGQGDQSTGYWNGMLGGGSW